MRLLLVLIILLLLIVTSSATASVPVMPGTTVRASNLTEYTYSNYLTQVNGSTLCPTCTNTIPQNISGSFNVSFDCGSPDVAGGGKCQLYKNEVALTSNTAGDLAYATYTYTISGTLNTTDFFAVKVQGWNSAYPDVRVRNFQVMYDYKYPDPPELDTNYIYSNYTSWSLGQTYTGSSVTVNIIPRVNKSSPYDLFNATGLIGRWHLDDNLTDVSGQSHNGTFNGTTNYTSAEFNNGTYFNGNTYINTTTTAYNFGINDPYTFIIWEKSVKQTSTYPMLFATLNSAIVGIQGDIDTTIVNSPFVFNWYGATGNIVIKETSGLNITGDSIWHQFVVTHNGSGKASGIKIYRDGVLLPVTVNSDTLAGSVTGSPLLFGSRPYAHDQNFTGWIDEVQVYNRSLNQTEINSTYFVKPSNLQVKTNSGIEDWQGNWNNYNSMGGDSPISIATGGSFNALSINVPSSYNQSGVNVTDFQRLAYFNITATATASNVSYISPTKINASEAWGVNTTTIKIQGLKNIANATLYWQPTKGSESRIDVYQMNSENNTIFSYNFTNLYDGDFPYYVFVNFSDGTNTTMSKYFVKIEFDFYNPPSDFSKQVFLWSQSDGQFASNATLPSSWGSLTFVEKEYNAWLNPIQPSSSYPSVLLYSCWNSSSGLLYDDTSCGSNASTPLAYIGVNWHPYLIPLNQYINSSGHLVSLAGRTNIPGGYSYHKTLGYVMGGVSHKEDVVYINNSKVKVGLDKKYGGAIVYLSELNSTYDVVAKNSIGRLIQNDYVDVANSSEIYNQSFYYTGEYGWNPTLAGDMYEGNSTTISYNLTVRTADFDINPVRQWNPSNNHNTNSDLELIVNYSFDGENPVLIAKYEYIHHGNVTHLYWGHETPAMHLIDKQDIYKYRYDNGTYTGDGNPYVNFSGVIYGALLNNSNWGVGLQNSRRPQMAYWNFTYDNSSGIGVYGSAVNKLSAMPYFMINKTGESGSTGQNVARFYVGNLTLMDAYYIALEFIIGFDPSTPTNQTAQNQNYINIRVNATDTAQIQNATLNWTNSTGSYNLPMTVSALGDYAYRNMTGLSLYNYSYSVKANATTGAQANTGTSWTNQIDTIPPASITNPQTITGNFYINNTWIDPTDSDFNYTAFYYSNGTLMQNVSKGIQFMNMTYSPHYQQNISGQTVDTSGNMNLTKVWLNATIPNNAPSQNTIGNKNVNEGQLLAFQIITTDKDGDSITYGTNATKGALNSTGYYSWTPGYNDSGVYNWYFNSTDNAGSQSITVSENITVTVNNVPLLITAYNPASDPATNSSQIQSFNMTVSRITHFTWYQNGVIMQYACYGCGYGTMVNYSTFTPNLQPPGIYNITVVSTDEIDTVTHQWNWTVFDITSIWNSVNGYNQTALTLNVGNSVTFNVSSNVNMSNWSWKINGAEQQNTSNNQFTKLFDTIGSYNVTIQGFNNNGSTKINYTVVTVQTSGGGGSTYDWLDGYVKDSLSNPIGGASVQTSQGSSTTSAGNGYYSFGYIFVQGNTYQINFSKSGYNNNNQSLAFTTDHMILNVTMSQILPAGLFNVSGYVLNQSNLSTLPGASVSSSGLVSNTSDNSGFWIIRNVTNGTKIFTASLAGYQDNSTTVTIAGSDLTNVNISLLPVVPTPTPTPTPAGNISINATEWAAVKQKADDAYNFGVLGVIGFLISIIVLKKRRA